MISKRGKFNMNPNLDICKVKEYYMFGKNALPGQEAPSLIKEMDQQEELVIQTERDAIAEKIKEYVKRDTFLKHFGGALTGSIIGILMAGVGGPGMVGIMTGLAFGSFFGFGSSAVVQEMFKNHMPRYINEDLNTSKHRCIRLLNKVKDIEDVLPSNTDEDRYKLRKVVNFFDSARFQFE